MDFVPESYCLWFLWQYCYSAGLDSLPLSFTDSIALSFREKHIPLPFCLWKCADTASAIILPNREFSQKELQYILLHELTHLAVFNHSPAFYAKLAGLLPDWQLRRKQLEAFPSPWQPETEAKKDSQSGEPSGQSRSSDEVVPGDSGRGKPEAESDAGFQTGVESGEKPEENPAENPGLEEDGASV